MLGNKINGSNTGFDGNDYTMSAAGTRQELSNADSALAGYPEMPA